MTHACPGSAGISATPASAGQGAPRAILHGVRRAAPLLIIGSLYALAIGLLLDVALRVWS
jgi:hypothetical protein